MGRAGRHGRANFDRPHNQRSGNEAVCDDAGDADRVGEAFEACFEGVELQAGDEIGVVEGPGTSCPVLSPFDGTLMGMLAHPGERLRSGQAIAWLRVA